MAMITIRKISAKRYSINGRTVTTEQINTLTPEEQKAFHQYLVAAKGVRIHHSIMPTDPPEFNDWSNYIYGRSETQVSAPDAEYRKVSALIP